MSINEAVSKFELYLLSERRAAHNTVVAYVADVKQLAAFCARKKIKELSQLDDVLVKLFLGMLKKRLNRNISMARKVASLRAFFLFLHERFQLRPLQKALISPKLEGSLPKALSIEETQELLTLVDQDQSPVGIRNKTIIYLLYATGMRISELLSLHISSFEHNGFVRVFGKGSKERMVPLTEPMQQLAAHYIEVVRPQLVKVSQTELLFSAAYGKRQRPLTRQAVWKLLNKIAEPLRRAGKNVSPHVLRHSLATHLLQGGADLRSLQILLGHEQLTTVQIYTKVETSHLRAMYDKKHSRS